MSVPRIYIDGQEGTTGLRIRELLAGRQDIEQLLIPAEDRKNVEIRRQHLNAADLDILCLPDDAAGEAVRLIDNPDTLVIDTSSARRTASGWVYGLPELRPEQREAIRTAQRVANAGCYPVGFLLAVRPLIEAGLLDTATPLTVNAVSGYSGGGRRLIEAYRAAPAAEPAGDAALPLSLYSLDLEHKHLPEMHRYSGCERPPLFVPSVDHAFCGMLVSTPIPAASLAGGKVTPEDVWKVWHQRYDDEPFVRPVKPGRAAAALRNGRFLDLGGCNYTNHIDLFVFGRPEVGLVLIGRQDNLGKGASGNAVQCMNLMLGFEETAGLG